MGAAQEAADDSKRSLRIVAVATAAEWVVPSLLRAFTKSHPEINLSLEVANRDSVFERVLEHEVDVAIAGRPVDAGNKVPEPMDYHGTSVAGLIAGHVRQDGGGPVGIAPWAKIFDVQVYDEADASTAPSARSSTSSRSTPTSMRRRDMRT